MFMKSRAGWVQMPTVARRRIWAGVAAGMAILTTIIGLPFLVSRAKSEMINRWLTIASGVLSLAFGIYLAYQIGFVDGLFTGEFNWEPH